MRLNLFVKKHAINMSAVAGIDQLVPGRVISCKTMHDEQFTGSIVAADPHSSIVMIKCSRSKVVLVNLRQIKWLEIDAEKPGSIPQVPKKFAIGKLEQRLSSNIKEKLNLTQEDGHDEDPLGAKLIQKINRILECKWEGKNIVVVDSGIEIRPPFNKANIFMRKEGNEYGMERISKILSKFHEEFCSHT